MGLFTQGVLPFRIEEEKGESGMTALAGLPAYLELAAVLKLREAFEQFLPDAPDSQGWTNWQCGLHLVLLNLAGGESVSDLDILNADDGFGRILLRVEDHRQPRRARRETERRWRKERTRNVVSPSAAFRFLAQFHDPAQEKLRNPKEAFIPKPNAHLQALPLINGRVVAQVQARRPVAVATLEMDATLVETFKEDALFCYKRYKAYQPLNVFWSEQRLMLHTQFRDGNVPAGYRQLEVFTEALALLPEGVEKICLRSDTAGYEHALMSYCALGKNERFGVIEFSVGVDISPQFRKAVAELPEERWQPVVDPGKVREDGTATKEYLEVPFVPEGMGFQKDGPIYRYIAVRELLAQQPLPGMEKEQPELPFPTMEMGGRKFKLHALVTNNWDRSAPECVAWHYGRCGRGEEVHSILKEDFAGGKLPSGDFGENAAWWWLAVLAMNLNQAMKSLVLGEIDPSWVGKRAKAIRFGLINAPGRVLEASRYLHLRFAHGHPLYRFMARIREVIYGMQPARAG